MEFKIYKTKNRKFGAVALFAFVNACCGLERSTGCLLQQTIQIGKMGGVIVIHRRGKSGCFLRGSSLSKYYFQPVDLVINFLIPCVCTTKSERDPC
jgi:hypothetical protein